MDSRQFGWTIGCEPWLPVSACCWRMIRQPPVSAHNWRCSKGCQYWCTTGVWTDSCRCWRTTGCEPVAADIGVLLRNEQIAASADSGTGLSTEQLFVIKNFRFRISRYLWPMMYALMQLLRLKCKNDKKNVCLRKIYYPFNSDKEYLAFKVDLSHSVPILKHNLYIYQTDEPKMPQLQSWLGLTWLFLVTITKWVRNGLSDLLQIVIHIHLLIIALGTPLYLKKKL